MISPNANLESMAAGAGNLSLLDAKDVYYALGEKTSREQSIPLKQAFQKIKADWPELYSKLQKFLAAVGTNASADELSVLANESNAVCALSNEHARATLEDYKRLFDAELSLANSDPIRAHRAVINKNPALAAKLRAHQTNQP